MFFPTICQKQEKCQSGSVKRFCRRRGRGGGGGRYEHLLLLSRQINTDSSKLRLQRAIPSSQRALKLPLSATPAAPSTKFHVTMLCFKICNHSHILRRWTVRFGKFDSTIKPVIVLAFQLIKSYEFKGAQL